MQLSCVLTLMWFNVKSPVIENTISGKTNKNSDAVGPLNKAPSSAVRIFLVLSLCFSLLVQVVSDIQLSSRKGSVITSTDNQQSISTGSAVIDDEDEVHL